MGLCTSCDECPSGKWGYFGSSFFVAAGIGTMLGKGTFKCLGKEESVQMQVQWGCMMGGVILGAGGSADGDMGFNFAEGCSRKDLYGRCRGFLSTAGPITVSSSWSDTGHFCGTLLGLGVNLLRPRLAAGVAYIDCYSSPRGGEDESKRGTCPLSNS